MIEQFDKLKDSFDVVFQTIHLNEKEITCIYLSSLTSQSAISDLMEGFLFSEHQQLYFFNGSVQQIEEYKQAEFLLLSGQCIVLQNDNCYAIETRSYPTRGIHEPSIEKSIRGSSDSFDENILHNVGLIRRRIRHQDLTFELYQEGELTKTDICLVYMKDRIHFSVYDDFLHRLKNNQNIEINNERNLIEALFGKTWNPYPHVRYSERPDICSIHLLQGNLIVLVDNMPSSMILPTTFFEQLQQIEEYTQTPLVAILTRLIRLLGVFCSLYLLPFVLACILSGIEPFVNTRLMQTGPAFLLFQVLLCELLIEWIRQSLLYAPQLISSIMGFVVVFVLGDIGVEMNAYTKEILVLVALSNLGNFLTPSYEVGLANKISRILMTMSTIVFGMLGFIVSLIIHFYVLYSTQTLHVKYLYPFFPFDWKEIKRIFLDTNIYTK